MDKDALQKLEGMGITAELMAKLELHANLPVVEELKKLNKNIEALVAKEMPEMPSHPDKMKVEIEGVEVLTFKGDKGDTGEKGENGIDGKDGKDGKDGRNGIDGETPKVDYPTIISDVTKNVNEALTPLVPKKEDIENDIIKSGEVIRDSLEKLDGEERLDKSAIKGLDEQIEELKKSISTRSFGGVAVRRIFQPKRDDLSASCDGSTKVFYLSKAPLDDGLVQVVGTDFPVILRPTIDFTIANKTLTLTDAIQAPNTGATLLVYYYT